MSRFDEQKKQVKALCRNYLSVKWLPISQMQQQSSRDPPARGPVWISRTSFAAPKDFGLRDALYRVCDRLGTPGQSFPLASDLPLKDVGVEFTGWRSGVDDKAPEPGLSEVEKLHALENECESKMTILYIHGGGLYTGSPGVYRGASTRLARLTKARVASVKYRLAPANTFPAPILDLLVAYASLLYPPAGSHHKPVTAEHVVFAGSSAGANLCFALLRLLLEMKRGKPQLGGNVLFHSAEVPLPLPSGVAICSGWFDQCDALPSWLEGGDNDILDVLQPALQPGYPTDHLWPSDPPREHPYCAATMLDHELVSPAAVSDWTGAPPMWFACGSEERVLDSNKVVASQAARCGVPISWNLYEGMPHEFTLLLGKLPQAKHCFTAWADACKALVQGKVTTSRSKLIKMPNCDEEGLGDVKELAPLPFDEVRKRMKIRNRERPVWTGKMTVKARI